MFDIPMIYQDYPEQEVQINQCIHVASEAYQIDPILLRAIREQERGYVGFWRESAGKSYDYGPMQINSIHLGSLKKFGITAEQLVYDACINVAAGAWHLRNKLNETGGDIWKAVGWYHSKTPKHGHKYRDRVKAIYDKLKLMILTSQPPQLAKGDQP